MGNRYPWRHNKRYNDFSTFFRDKFSERVQKLSIDAGFTCPNRDGSKGIGGCTYCNNTAFKPAYCKAESSITTQIKQGVDFFSKRYNARCFLAYFQSYSGTYAPLKTLKKLYTEALSYPGVRGLVIATRPDCLNAEVLDYLKHLSGKYYIMVEIGVESIKNETLSRLNRRHTWEESVSAIEKCSKLGIHNCVHVILGLPGETNSDIMEQSTTISRLPIENIKLHQLQIHKGTAMAEQYTKAPEDFILFSEKEYIDIVIGYLERLNPEIVVERFVSSTSPEMLLAPKWGLKNFEFSAKVEKQMEKIDTWQGRLAQPR